MKVSTPVEGTSATHGKSLGLKMGDTATSSPFNKENIGK